MTDYSKYGERIKQTVEGFIKEQERATAELNGKIKMWQNVERKHTKSGGDFKSLNRNFDEHLNVHASYTIYHTTTWHVDGWMSTKDHKYFEDSFSMETEAGSEPTPDEIMEKIGNIIETYKALIEDHERMIEAAPALAECLQNVDEEIRKAAPISRYEVQKAIMEL